MPGISNHFDTMVAIKALIDGMGMFGITGGVVLQEVATFQDKQIPLPFISVSPYGPEKVGDELNDRDGVYYGTLVAIMAMPDIQSLELRLGWRQTMRRRLNNVALSGLPMCYRLKVEPGNVVEPKVYFDRDGFVSGFVVRANFQEPRL